MTSTKRRAAATREKHRIGAWVMTGLMVLIPGVGRAQTGPAETRDFAVSIDGKPAGNYRMAIAPQTDGTIVITNQANVHLKFLGGLKQYTYVFQGRETWQNGRLLRLESTANDDGKPLAVTAVAEGNTLRVRANGQERRVRPDVWTTSYWHLADPRFRNRGVPLLDADTGKEMTATLQFMGAEQRPIAGQVLTVNHYRLTGSVQADLWYDAQERLVRQESLEEGHRTVLELTSGRR